MADDITPKYPIVPMSDSVAPLDEGFGAKIGGYGGLGGTLAKDVEAATATVEETINSDGNFINDVINARLDSSSKKILSDFDFGTTDYAGALKSGDITWNTSTGAITGGSGVAIYRGGIVGANEGATTFSIDAVTGNATFAGTLSSPDGTIGGFTISATSISTSGMIMDSANDEFLIGTASNRIISMEATGLEYYVGTTRNASISLSGTNILGINAGGNTTPILVLFERTGVSAGVVRPDSGDTINLGNATTFWNDVSYKTLTDRGCVLPGTIVSQGFYQAKQIDDISAGEVAMADGKNDTILQAMYRNYDGSVYGINPIGLPTLWLTEEHPVYVRPVRIIKGRREGWGTKEVYGEPEWVKAKDLNNEYAVYSPTPELEWEDTDTSDDLAWLYGMYLSEGHMHLYEKNDKHGESAEVGFTLALHEMDMAERIVSIFKKEFGVEPSLTVRENKNIISIRCYRKEIALRFVELLGKGAANKAISPNLKLSESVARNILLGWIDGDGSDKKDGCVVAATISPTLGWQMFYLAKKLGLKPAIKEYAQHGIHKKSYYISFYGESNDVIRSRFTVQSSGLKNGSSISSDGMWYPIRKVTEKHYEGVVFNFEIDNSHTYTVGGILVHNCLGWFDEGVELQDGTKVSDTEALLAIKKHPTKLTVYGKPMLDYSSLPKDVYRPATDGKGKLYKRGKNGEPLPFTEDGKEVQPQDGAETTALISIILGAVKESALEIIKLKEEITQLKAQLAQ